MKADSGLSSNKYKSVFNKAEFDAVTPETTDYLFGILQMLIPQ